MLFEVYRNKDKNYSYCDGVVNALPVEVTSYSRWREFRYGKVPSIGSIFETKGYKVTVK